VSDQQAVLERFDTAHAAAVAAGPIVTVIHGCDCGCECCGEDREETHYAPVADAFSAISGDLQSLAWARRFDGLVLLPRVAELIAAYESMVGCKIDLTADELNARMLDTLAGIGKALGADMPPALSTAPRP